MLTQWKENELNLDKTSKCHRRRLLDVCCTFSCVQKVVYITSFITIKGYLLRSVSLTVTSQKNNFFIKDFFSKCDHICSILRIFSHLLKKSLMESFIFVQCLSRILRNGEQVTRIGGLQILIKNLEDYSVRLLYYSVTS